MVDLFAHTQLGAGDEPTYETYHVVVRFEARGRQVLLQARVSEALYAACWRGQMLALRYAHDDPRIALLEGEW